MTKKVINFKREREFGDHFNAAFNFIIQEIKPLGTAILYFVAPFLLLYAIAMTAYSFKAQEFTLTSAQIGHADPLTPFAVIASQLGHVGVYLGIAMLLSLISTTMLFCTVYGYIKLYVKKGAATVGEVWTEISDNFFSCFFALFITSLVILTGVVLCVIPGIYFGVALCILPCILIFEGKDFSTAFSRSIKLINTNWWATFGTLFITTIILYILVLVVSVPNMIFGFKSFFTSMKNVNNPQVNFSLTFYIINAMTHLLTQLLMVVPVVIVYFIYYSTVEKVEKPSLLEKIDQI
jgi:hypothetical protein